MERVTARRACALALMLLFPVLSSAENNCGAMLRTLTRYRGTVRSIEPLGRRRVTITPVDLDVSFVVTIHVDAVDAGNPVPAAGQTLRFGIHSPTLTFAASDVVGRTFDLESEVMQCDGAFRRFLTLRRHSATPLVESIDGFLEIGHTYRATVEWTPEGSLTLTTPLPLPRHHMGGVAFLNVDAFPALKRPGAAREIVFAILSVRITQEAERQWISVYDARIVSAR